MVKKTLENTQYKEDSILKVIIMRKNPLIFFAFIVLTACFTLISFKKKPEKKPNILLIVSEDHSPHLSCYGDKVIKTANIDKIAENGLLFKNAYVTQSVCSPSRSSILSGLYPHQNGHLGLTTHGFHYVGEVKNLYSVLKKAGYRTGMIGKLHVDPANDFPIDYHPITSPNYEKKGLSRYAAFAEQFMNGSDEPFFLMVNFPDTHWPFQNSVEGRPANPLTPDQVKPFSYMGFDNKRIREYTTGIYNCMLRLDQSIGELMTKLNATGKTDNTLVIYLSDHGDEMARGKFDIYEVGTKVPFLASWPGVIEPGTQSDAMISTIDIVPTIFEITGIRKPGKLPGSSLLPVFKNPDNKVRDYLFTEKNCDQIGMYYPRRAVRDKKYKLILSLLDNRENEVARKYMKNGERQDPLGGSPTLDELKDASDATRQMYYAWLNPPKVQLYDLDADPWEMRDLSGDPKFQNVKERLLKELVKWQKETDDPLRFPERLKRLTEENDTMKISKNMIWQYPHYLYGK